MHTTDRILRFRASERHLHWAIAIPFIVCYATAAVLVLVYNGHPTLAYRGVFSWIHRLSGACLILLPLLTVVVHWRDFRLHLHNVGCVSRWAWADIKWLLLAGPAMISGRVALPEQGKFNAGEKINFAALISTYPVYIGTGLVIWFSTVPFLAWMIHVCTALFVATPLMLGHVYLAIVNPDTRIGLSGMISGYVDRHWARHHYTAWYRELYGADQTMPEQAPEETPAATPPPAAASRPQPATRLPVFGLPETCE